MLLNRKTFLPLIFIFAICTFFRFYNFTNLQFWSGDDEIMTATIRHIVWDRSPILLIPNSFLGFGLGPFYYYFLSVFYFLTSFNLVLVQAIASLLGIATTYLLYLSGKVMNNEKLGLTASLLYASSFLLAFFDRRVWPLTLGPFMSVLAFICFAKLIQKDWRFLPILAIPIGFALHSDLSLLIVAISAIFVFTFFRLPVLNKFTALFLVVLAIFISTFVLAEIRYQGAVSGPVLKSLTRPLRGEAVVSSQIYSTFGTSDFLDAISRIFFTTPDVEMEKHWCHSQCNYPKPPFSPLLQMVVFGLLIMSPIYLIKKKARKANLLVLWIMFASFVLGTVIFNRVFKANFNQLYFLTIFPIVILIIAGSLLDLIGKRKIILKLLFTFYILYNFYSLFNSSIKYPLSVKIRLVEDSLLSIGNDKFAISSSHNPDVEGGGWTEIYAISKHPPVKSYWYDYGEWLYQAYSLFPGPIQKEDPDKIVILQKVTEDLAKDQKIISKYVYKDLELNVVDNSSIDNNSSKQNP